MTANISYRGDLEGAEAGSETWLCGLLREMIAARRWSGRLLSLQRQGRIGTFSPIDGEEAAVVGAAAAMDPVRDWVVPQYREPLGLGRFGGDELLYRTILGRRGHPAGGETAALRVFPVQIAIAAQVPHAVGLAWGMRLRAEEGVVLVFFGDGATSEGDFAEGANLAGVLRAPVVLCCLNNGWAISTPRAAQSAAAALADRAVGFGMPGVQVDGNDVVAVHDAVAAARARAVSDEGPTLIEAVTYRMGPHTTADDPSRYVPDAELETWAERDPIARLRASLEARGAWDADAQARAEADADARLDEAVARAEAEPLAPDALFDHAYRLAPPRVVEQRRRFDERAANANATGWRP